MSRQDDIKRLIVANNRRLQKLKEQQAMHGIDTPPATLLEIENIQAELAELEAELNRLEATLPPEIEPTADEAPAPGESPFKGLQFFDVADSNLFFGREQLTAELVDHLRHHTFLAVVGASGSGKSSLARAGLVAALQKGEPLADGSLPPGGSQDWAIHVITPTAEPLESLALSLTRQAVSVIEAATLIDDLQQDSRCLHLYIRKLLAQPAHRQSAKLFLLIDQFEELFTLCRDEVKRRAFVDNLLTTVEREDSSAIVVMTLRADFYTHCGQYERLREMLESRQKYIGPMSQAELRRAIEKPVELGNWRFAPGLVELLLRDVGDEPGALPLLSHALLETWKRRRGRTLTLAGYAGAGGVHGAIAKTAESVFAQLSVEQQPIARNIFLRLTELGEGTQDTRRRASLAELIPQAETKPEVETVLKVLADARLVTTEQESVEVAHEALIREWPLLRRWLDENRESLRLHRRLGEAAGEWAANKRDPSYLYGGNRLAQATEWVESADGDRLNEQERAFFEASLAEQRRQEQEREQQRQRELEAAQKLAAEAEARQQAEEQRAQEAEARAQEQEQAAARLRKQAMWLAGAVALAAILAVVAGIFGWQSSKNATKVAQQLEAAEAELNFSRTAAPEERLALLARLVALGRTEMVVELFDGLPTQAEQLAMLKTPDEGLVAVCRVLAMTLADVGRIGYGDPFLEAMAEGLANLPQPAQEAITLQADLEQWLSARRAARQENYQAAKTVYDELRKRNDNNPALFYERARVLASLGQPEDALADLEQMLALVNDSPALFDTGQVVKSIGRLLYRVEPTLGELFEARKGSYSHLAEAGEQLMKVKEDELVRVEAGPFEMGSNDGDDDEKPAHTVTVEAFEIDRYEVTNAEYAACVDAGGCKPLPNNGSATRDNYYGQPGYADYPVISVDWYRARTYCQWRGARLPTEAEWEKAARGTGGRTYPWGEGIDCTLANYYGCKGDTTRVGTYPEGASPYGAYDMAGNVWEWTQSEYKDYPYDANDGRNDFNDENRTNVRVLRGGSWYSGNVRAASRDDLNPTLTDDLVGFRCAR